MSTLIELAERRWLPDPWVRLGIRRLCRDRLRTLGGDAEFRAHVERLRQSPLTIHADAANEQHYEVPADFYRLVLGPHLKYSSGYWEPGATTLAEAEAAALKLTMERAGLRDGMRILELGCGWGSLTLEMARRFPRAQITALSNSRSQREFIEAKLRAEGLTGVRVITADIATFDALDPESVDRVVSVEMFEHVRNYGELFRRIARWLAPGGELFFHVFAHRQQPYVFDTEGDDNWMGRHFFTGGQMPSERLFREFQDHLIVDQTWTWEGTHYARTAEAWLDNLDAHEAEATAIFAREYGEESAKRWVQRWRMFFMACAELFGFDGGQEWVVNHLRLRRRGES